MDAKTILKWYTETKAEERPTETVGSSNTPVANNTTASVSGNREAGSVPAELVSTIEVYEHMSLVERFEERSKSPTTNELKMGIRRLALMRDYLQENLQVQCSWIQLADYH